jgi:hypothetical protein
MLLKILIFLFIIIVIIVVMVVFVVVLLLNLHSRLIDSMPKSISHVHRLNWHCASHLWRVEFEAFSNGWGAPAQLLLFLSRLNVASRFKCTVSIFVMKREKRWPFSPALVRYWLSTCSRRCCAVIKIRRCRRYSLEHLVR